MNVQWNCKKFNELSPFELYQILKLRSEVFVIEQNCVYPDMDDKDLQSYHLCVWYENKLAAYARLLPPGLSFKEISIGRVSTSKEMRRFGLGKELMKKAIENCALIFKKNSIKIGAQLYLKKFYESLGFQQISEMYLEDNIEHIEMILEL